MVGNIMNKIIQCAQQTVVIKLEEIVANDYNPNRMPDREMAMLEKNIKKYGFLFPILVVFDAAQQKYRIIDGYHRYEAMRRLNQKGYKGADQISCIIMKDMSLDEAMELTVLMNEIKGMHQVEGMADLIQRLKDQGVSPDEICKALNKPRDEINRLLMQKGIAPAFADSEYTSSFEIEDMG
jgi:ParB-like chromosome segregation protein Spo0J